MRCDGEGPIRLSGSRRQQKREHAAPVLDLARGERVVPPVTFSLPLFLLALVLPSALFPWPCLRAKGGEIHDDGGRSMGQLHTGAGSHGPVTGQVTAPGAPLG